MVASLKLTAKKTAKTRPNLPPKALHPLIFRWFLADLGFREGRQSISKMFVDFKRVFYRTYHVGTCFFPRWFVPMELWHGMSWLGYPKGATPWGSSTFLRIPVTTRMTWHDIPARLLVSPFRGWFGSYHSSSSCTHASCWYSIWISIYSCLK